MDGVRPRDRLRGTFPGQGTGFEAAASIYRACRSTGITLRGLVDCLIAAIALRSGAFVMAHDRDFDRISAIVPLRLDSYN
jgi:hypothetical protein